MLEQQQQRKKKRKNKQERSRRKKGGGAGEGDGRCSDQRNFKPRTFLNGFWAVQRRFLQDPVPPMLETPTMIQETPRGEEK